MRRKAQAGFSLIELLVAMVVTLFVVGAVVGLLTSGQSAFKTQPERTDRQQNIRAAMDIIMRDVGAAGIGMPVFMQVFSRGQNSVGPATNPDGNTGPTGNGGALTDQMTIIANTEGFENEATCSYPGGHSVIVDMLAGGTRVQANSAAIVIMADGTWTLRYVTQADLKNSGASGDCSKGGTHAALQMTAGQDPSGLNLPSGLCVDNGYGNAYIGVDGILNTADDAVNGTCQPKWVSTGDIIQYRVCTPPNAACPSGEAGVPNLERNVNTAGWQVLARGIEDLQVKYVRADVARTLDHQPAQIMTDDYSTLTTEVQVTLASRGAAGKFQGAMTASTGPMAIRGSLTSQASPRMALWALT